MLLDPNHATTLAEARSYIAALADAAHTVGASCAYERALIQLDWIHYDDVPALDSAGLTKDREVLSMLVTSSLEELRDSFGLDPLEVELLHASLADARALDEP